MLKPVLSVALTAIIWAQAAVAAGAQNDLRMGMLSLALSADPHAYVNTGARELAGHLYQPLYEKTAEQDIPYHVTKSGRKVSNDTWELQLYPGDISANDVLFTLCRIRNYPGSGSPFLSSIKSIDAVSVTSNTKVRISTQFADNELLSRMATIPVMKAPVNWTGTYTGGICNGPFAYSRAELDSGTVTPGTGPYRLEAFSDERIVMVRQDGKAGPVSPWRRVVQQLMSTEEAVRALIGGSVDVIDSVPDGPAAHLASVSDTKTVYGYPSSFAFIQLNQRPNSPFIANGTGNPLRDRRVRKAISLALDREFIATRQRFDPGIPTAQIALSDNPLYNDRISLGPNIERAKALLAEAGYAKGFTVDLLMMPGTTWVADKIEPMVARIGIDINVRDVGERYPDVLAKGEFGLNLNVSVVDQSDTISFVRSRLGSADIAAGFGGRNHSAYKSNDLNELLLKINPERSSEDILTIERKIMELIDAEQFIIPVMFIRPRWHLQSGLDLKPRRDNRMLAWNIIRISG